MSEQDQGQPDEVAGESPAVTVQAGLAAATSSVTGPEEDED